MSKTVLEARNLSVGYGGQAVVRDLNLAVRAGEIVFLFGNNGSGKTSTLLTLAGELPPIDGETRFLGEATRAPLYQRVRRGLAFITDERSLVFSLTARDNLRLRGGSVDGALALFPELEPHLDKPAGLLSGGQQQMVAMARSLANEPRVLMLRALRQAADRGLGVLLVEQHVSKALAISDRALVLSQGRVVLEGDAADLKQRVGDIEAAYLAGASEKHRTDKHSG